MKKVTKLFWLIMMILAIAVPATALAATWEPYEKGPVTITATVEGNTATITVQGFQVDKLERYYWKNIDKSSGFAMDLTKGKRFQLLTGGKYLYLTPDMAGAACPYNLVGVGIDCSNPNGCCLYVK